MTQSPGPIAVEDIASTENGAGEARGPGHDEPSGATAPDPSSRAVRRQRRPRRPAPNERAPAADGHQRRFGIRSRVVTTFVVLLAVALVVATASISQVLHGRFDAQVDEELVRTTEGIRRGVTAGALEAGAGSTSVRADLAEHLADLAPRADEAVLVILDGEPALTTDWAPVRLDELDAVRTWATLTTSRIGEIDTPAGRARFVVTPIADPDRTVGQIAVVRLVDAERVDLDDTIRTITTILAVVLGAATLVAWGSVGRALRPMRRLAGSVRAVVDLGALKTRVQEEGSDEVGDLARAFNEMLDHLDEAYASQKSFIDGVGHDLRTPITIVRGHLELMDDDPVEQRRTLDLVLAELDRMDRLVEDLRLIARSQRPDFLRREGVPIGQLTRDLVANGPALARRRWRLGRVDDAVIDADPDRLVEALVNIIDNAVRATSTWDIIELSCVVEDGTARISVADSGPGIPESERERIFLPSARGHAGDDGGTGLGLAIAMSIAQAHGGTIALESTPTGATFGLCVPAVVKATASDPGGIGAGAGDRGRT
jgi:two-component system, OmpR family, sensor kinase